MNFNLESEIPKNYNDDELCVSLNQISLKGIIPTDKRLSIDEIMEDFKKNGKNCDDLSDDENGPMTINKKILNETHGKMVSKRREIPSCYKKPTRKIVSTYCVFCENNKENEAVVKSHAVRDSRGRVLCPKLRIYVCPICGESGDNAHTLKYCPQKRIITMEETIKMDFIRSKLCQRQMRL